MWHWLSQAFSTYVLHTERGNGYLWWSGPGADLGMLTALILFTLKHNCHTHRCPRIGRMIGPDGHHRCKRHHNTKPNR